MSMRSPILASVLLSSALPGLLRAELPPGYRLEQVTRNEYLELNPKINNLGQFVFSARYGTFEEDKMEEIILYDHGNLIRLTHDTKRDAFPDINDAGTVVWSRAMGPRGRYGKTYEIVMYRDGELIRLTDNDIDDFAPRINNLGHVVWFQWEGQGCENSSANIMYFDGQTVTKITDDLYSNQGVEINDRGEIVWTRYDFCPQPWWDSDILLLRDGMITQIDDQEDYEPRAPHLNNEGTVVFSSVDHDVTHDGIRVWKDGVVTWLTDWGRNPRINDRGDIYFIRWYDDNRTWQSWLYLGERFYQLTDDPFWNTDGDINNQGQVVWGSGNVPWTDIRFIYPDEGKGVESGQGSGNRVDPKEVYSVPNP
jgi:hypothetical protein